MTSCRVHGQRYLQIKAAQAQSPYQLYWKKKPGNFRENSKNSWIFLFYLSTIISTGYFWEVKIIMPKISKDSLLFQTNEVTVVLFLSPLLTDFLQPNCSSLGERWLKFWSSVLVFYFCFHDSCFWAYSPRIICIQNFGSNDRTQCVQFFWWEKLQFHFSKKPRKFLSNGEQSQSRRERRTLINGTKIA